MKTKEVMHGILTAASVGAMAYLFFANLHIVLRPIPIEVRPEQVAYGYNETLTPLCNNMVAYWKFDEGTGTQAVDTSQNNHHGVLTNMTSGNWSSDTAAIFSYENDYSLQIASANKYVTAGVDTDLQVTGDMTISMWINYSSLATGDDKNVLIANGTAGESLASNFLYYLNIKNDKTMRMLWENGASATDVIVESSTVADITGGTWKHVAVTRDATEKEVKFYVSGALLGTAQSYDDNPTGGTSGKLYIGASPQDATSNFFSGKIDDVRIYSSVLTGSQIAALARTTELYDGCTCGNGTIESPEECDNGDSNSDTEADACRTTCVEAVCGDGIIDSNEACDDGNSVDTDSCTNSCAAATCGDGIIQAGTETCDNAGSNSDTESDACRTTCLVASCGDGVVDTGETCDPGEETEECDSDCSEPVCGDGVLNTTFGEECDDGDENSDSESGACRTDCTNPVCGDGVEDPGELCDDGNSVNEDGCTNTCRTPSCGDGYIQISNNETCEPPGTATCASNCIGRSGGGTTGGRRRSSSSSSARSYATREPPPAGCGNRIFEPELKEECDEGELNGKGACSYYCKLLYCGDGIVSPELYETCEPEKGPVIDGVQTYVQNTCGTICTAPEIDPNSGTIIGGCQQLFLQPCAEQSSSDAPALYCGDGRIDDGEQCDAGGICEGGSEDGKVWSDEDGARTCRDGGGRSVPVSGDGCSDTCRYEICGDGIVQAAGEDGISDTADDEQCDNGSICSNMTDRSCTVDAQCGENPPCSLNPDGINTCGGTLDGEICESEFDCVVFGSCEYDGAKDAACTPQCKKIVCGNDKLEAGEACDDGNNEDGDGCSASCEKEEGFEFVCGDGIVSDEEGCDDGNTEDGDGCSASCTKELLCGDGEVDDGEACDDGNTEDGDGCSAACEVEIITDEMRDVRRTFCGNFQIDDEEECDDGFNNSDTEPNTCRTDCRNPSCGDFVVDDGEACDMGDANSDTAKDTCRLDCTLPRCGDGVLDSGEECDGSVSCTPSCTLAMSAVCGNGRIDAGEECDDGNLFNEDGCSQLCKEEPRLSGVIVCGNSRIERGETCDDGNVLNGDGCSDQCVVEAAASSSQQSSVTLVEGGSNLHSGASSQQSSASSVSVVQPDYQFPLYPSIYQANLVPLQFIPVNYGPVGQTGPVTSVILAVGATGGLMWQRRKRR